MVNVSTIVKFKLDVVKLIILAEIKKDKLFFVCFDTTVSTDDSHLLIVLFTLIILEVIYLLDSFEGSKGCLVYKIFEVARLKLIDYLRPIF